MLAKAPETRLPTKFSELRSQNVRLSVGKAFQSWILREQRYRNGGENINANKLRWMGVSEVN